MIYVFDDCALDTQLYLLHRAGQSTRLRPKVFQVLHYLLIHRDRVVSKDDLCKHVWSDQYISDAALESVIKAVRRAVGDSGRTQRIIQTLRGHGYRLAVEVTARSEAPSESVAKAHDEIPTQETDESPSVPAPLPGEQKMATILCCTLVNIPTASERLGLDALYNRMRQLYELIRTEAHQYGGTIQHVAGDRIMAVFGAPVAQEDHAHRAVLAALGLHQRLETHQGTNDMPHEETLTVRMGLHTGLVAVGGMGDDQEVAAAVIGATATLAAALQESAEPGTILCSATTAGLVRDIVHTEDAQPVQVPGQPAPMQVYKLLRYISPRGPMAQRGGRTVSRFVGRERELAALHALLDQVEDGRGQVVGIVGEPGMGKSRLLNEFRRSLTGKRLRYLQGRCLSYGHVTPYLPVLNLLRHNCGFTETDSPEVVTVKVHRCLQEVGMSPEEGAPYFLQLLGIPGGTDRLAMLSPQAIKAHTFATLVQMCLNGSQRRPLVVVLENLHWIDPTSEELLAALVEQIVGAPILILLTARPGYLPAWLDKSYATQLALPRLTSRDSRRVVQSVVQGEDLPNTVVQQILVKADGNPFFLEELTRTVMEQGDSRLPVTVPDTIQAVLAARIDRLAPEDKHLLQAASVIGRDVTLPLLQTMADVPEESLRRSLGHLQAAEFLYEVRRLSASAYTFKHTLTQEVVYQSLLQSTRQQYHQRIAQALTTQFPETAEVQPELLAHHYTEATLSEEAIRYWQLTGQRAVQQSAHVEAISHLTKGLELIETLPDTPKRIQQELSLLISLGPALSSTKGLAAPEVERVYTRARELSRQIGETPQRIQALRGLFGFYFLRAEHQTARGLGEQLLSLAQSVEDPAYLLEAHRVLGMTLFYRGELTAAREHLEQGIVLYNPLQHHAHAFLYGLDPGVSCRSYAAMVLHVLGYPDQALQKSHEALALAQQLSHPYSQAVALGLAALLYQFRREGHTALEQAEAALTLATEQGFVQWLAAGSMIRGWVLTEQGQGMEGIAQMQQGFADWRATGAELVRPQYSVLLAEAYSDVGHTAEGLRLVDEALELVHNNGECLLEAELHRLRGELLIQQGIQHKAEESLYRALETSRHQQAKSLELRAAMSLSRLWLLQEKRNTARELLVKIYDWFTEGFDIVDLQEAKALLGELT